MVETIEEEKARITREADARGEFVMGDCGYVHYWPDGGRGYLPAWVLRHLADELDRRNAEWDAQVQSDPALAAPPPIR